MLSFLLLFSSSRSDTERGAGSEPRAVPRSPAAADHSHWDDGHHEVRDMRSGPGPAGDGGGEGHVFSAGPLDGMESGEDNQPGVGVLKS